MKVIKLQRSIAETEALIKTEKLHRAEHQLYFSNVKRKFNKLLLILLIPAFISGWYLGKKKGPEKKLAKIANFGLIRAVNLIQKLY